MDNVDEQIDAVTRSVLGLTVSCARCHDHKFDPIPTTDYYALAGIFTSTDNAAGRAEQDGRRRARLLRPGDARAARRRAAPPGRPSRSTKLKAEVAEAKKAWDAIRGTPEGLKPAAERPADAAAVPAEVREARRPTARADRPGRPRARGPRRARRARRSATPRSASAARPRSSARWCRAASSPRSRCRARRGEPEAERPAGTRRSG